MKKLLVLGFAGVLFACGPLSEKDRKTLQEGRALQRIQKVSEAEILEMAFSQGREITQRESLLKEIAIRDSLEFYYKAQITWIGANPSPSDRIENKLMEAYLAESFQQDSLYDNVQKVGMDTLLYTKPIARRDSIGELKVLGLWAVYFTQKELILSMD